MTRLKSGKAHKISLNVKYAYEPTFEIDLTLPQGKSLSDISDLWVEFDDLCFTIGDREYRQRINALTSSYVYRWPDSLAAHSADKSWSVKG